MATSAVPQPALPDRRPEGGIFVEISNTQGVLVIDAEKLTRLVEGVLRDEQIERATISVALVDNATIHRINQQHLGHDWPTDVISFTLSSPDDAELAGELVISTEMAAATAAELNADPAAELALYVVHGLLHLCGHDDLNEPDIREMRARESSHLQRHGLSSTSPPAELSRPSRAGQEQAPCLG